MLELREAFGAMSAGRLFGDGSVCVKAISTDTRRIKAGDLFFAMRGDVFDANDFAPQAQAAGAAAVVVDRWVEGLRAPAILVKDARRAMGEVAMAWRRRFGLTVIAVTGSNGKTTVKEMVSSILAAHFGAEHRFATQGNLNGDIGVPLMMFELRPEHRAAVIELGMNHPGEIAWIASIAQAQVALVNNAQREHQEFMSSVEATARENGEAVSALPADGVAVFPGDDEHAAIWRGLAGARRRVEFGLGDGHEVRADAGAQPEGFTIHVGGAQAIVRLAIAGAHNVRNALAAAACCHAIGVPLAAIVAGLEAFRPVKGRLAMHRLASGATLIDDSYNANPDSVRAAVDVLAARASPRVLVLGDMGEVGEKGVEFHEEVGAYAKARGLEHLLCLGDATRAAVASFGQSGEHFADLDSIVARARMLATGTASVLVKGSRFMKMERVVAQLRGEPA